MLVVAAGSVVWESWSESGVLLAGGNKKSENGTESSRSRDMERKTGFEPVTLTLAR